MRPARCRFNNSARLPGILGWEETLDWIERQEKVNESIHVKGTQSGYHSGMPVASYPAWRKYKNETSRKGITDWLWIAGARRRRICAGPDGYWDRDRLAREYRTAFYDRLQADLDRAEHTRYLRGDDYPPLRQGSPRGWGVCGQVVARHLRCARDGQRHRFGAAGGRYPCASPR